ncbi:MAG: MotA/TolQ/ExbB proton channel family protein [Granulosicoccus sp.]
MTGSGTSKQLNRTTDNVSTLGADSSEFYPQLWLLLISLMAFGTYVAWDLNLFSLILALDKSYMASLTMTLVCVMSVHCGWHILHTSRHTLSAQRWLESTSRSKVTPAISSIFLQRFVEDLSSGQSDGAEDADAILEIHADAVRSPAELGWFFVDLAVRLGLLGTIIGFILIFASLDNIDIEGGDDLKNLLIAMSGGMGTALYTTLTGLIGASLLSFQYLILGRQCEHLVAQLLRIRRRLRHDAALLRT